MPWGFPTFYPPFSHHLPTKSASLGRVLGFLMTSGLREVVRGLAKNRRAPGGVAEVNTPGVYIIIYIMIKNNYILTIYNYIYIDIDDDDADADADAGDDGDDGHLRTC